MVQFNNKYPTTLSESPNISSEETQVHFGMLSSLGVSLSIDTAAITGFNSVVLLLFKEHEILKKNNKIKIGIATLTKMWNAKKSNYIAVV